VRRLAALAITLTCGREPARAGWVRDGRPISHDEGRWLDKGLHGLSCSRDAIYEVCSTTTCRDARLAAGSFVEIVSPHFETLDIFTSAEDGVCQLYRKE
jgi:hypothetical protein